MDVHSSFLVFQVGVLAGWRVVEGPHFLRLAARQRRGSPGVDVIGGHAAERYHTDANLVFATSLTLPKLLFYGSVVKGRYFAPLPFGRILVSFQVAKFAPVGLHVKIVVHLSLPIVESVHEGVAHFILSVHMHFGQRR